MSPRRIYLKNLSEILSRSKVVSKDTCIVIFDRKLLKAVPGFKTFIGKFKHSFPVTAGESLKSFAEFSKLTSKIHKEISSDSSLSVNRSWSVVAIGGGSVGDAAGFFASVYKRGLRLVHVPTTWLSAVDSSHGGKTALNLLGAKNQIGTFYEAQETILVQSVLMSLSESHRLDALGEFSKTAILDRKVKLKSNLGKITSLDLWKVLPQAIEAKLKIVRQDPTETLGHRQLLNLGHTMGHVFEAALGLSHGRSVGLGILFAIDVSEAESCLSQKRAEALRQWLATLGISKSLSEGPSKSGFRKVSVVQAKRLLLQDKKISKKESVIFIVIRDLGRCERREIPLKLLISTGLKAGWLK